MKIYLASPLDEEYREAMFTAQTILLDKGFDVYVPVTKQLEHAWDWTNAEWGLQVFRRDVDAIYDSDFVVVLNYGRKNTTVGTSIEQGIAYGIGKKVILVEMTDNIQSLMAANARYATVKGLEGLEKYYFYDPKPARVDTEQK
jgi:nucleoside 2-deoxyribosyltransferase